MGSSCAFPGLDRACQTQMELLTAVQAGQEQFACSER